jgi:hypothetical protein
MVYVDLAFPDVGVPEIEPVVVLKVKPLGRAGEMAKDDTAPSELVEVIVGVKAVIASSL